MDQEIAEQLAARDRHRRRIGWQRTPAERMKTMMQLQERARYLLSISPEGYAHFLRRNYKARATPDADPPPHSDASH